MAQRTPPADDTGPAPGMVFAAPIPRLIAYIIDMFLVTLLTLVPAYVIGLLISAAGEAGRDLLVGIGFVGFFLWVLAVQFGYFPWFWSHGGQTIGGKAMKIRVVYDEDGREIGFMTGFVRLVGYFLSAFVFYIGFLWILFDKRKHGWPDILASTCVVKA
jgi:uncharacterized RDD family membrane protein YckC